MEPEASCRWGNFEKVSVDQGLQRPLDFPRSRIGERRGYARGKVGAGDEAEVAEHARRGRVQSLQRQSEADIQLPQVA